MSSSGEEDLARLVTEDGEDSHGFEDEKGQEDEDEDSEYDSRRAVGPRLSSEAQQEGFPAKGMFSGAQDHPAYDSSNGGHFDDDESEASRQPRGAAAAEGGGGAAEGAAAAATDPGLKDRPTVGEDAGDGGGRADNEDDQSYLAQQTAEDDPDEWSSTSDVTPPLTGGGDHGIGPTAAGTTAAGTTAAAAAAAAATALTEEEEEAEEEEEEEGCGEGGGEVGEREPASETGTPPPPPSSNGMGWDSAAATAGGGVSEAEGRSVLSGSSGRAARGEGDGGGQGRQRFDSGPLSPFRGGGGDGGGGGGGGGGEDDSPLIAPSDIARNIPSPLVAGRDRESQAVIDALQEVYRKSLKPIEELSMFDKFHHDVMTDADLQAKPQVLLLGQYSTGKTSMIRHFIGRDFPGMHVSPEAGPEIFQVVTAGSGERTVKGSALCILDELPYKGLGKFGATFLGKFQASIVPSPLLEHMNFVDTPGMRTADKHATRGYPFPEVVKWFADRSDLILLVFDAHKLDMAEEFREVVRAIAQHGDRVRVVLNKAQEVDNDRLLKVYGALMWSIGRCLGSEAPAPKVYVGSFWDGPRRHPDDRPEDDDDSFDVDEAALLREMMELPKNVGVRKINDLMQRAKLVKVHLEIVYAVRARMPRIWGAEAAQDRILASLEEVFEEVKTKIGVHEADMPDVEEYRRGLARIDLRDLPRRNRRLLATLDDIVERDIKQCITRAGGVRRIYKLDAAARIVDELAPSAAGSRRRRRATMGDDRGRDRHSYSSAGLFGRSSRLSMHVDSEFSEDSEEDYGGGQGDDDDDDSFIMEAREHQLKGAPAEEDEVPFLWGTFVMVVVVFIGISAALWKTEALPPIHEWAVLLRPGSVAAEITPPLVPPPP